MYRKMLGKNNKVYRRFIQLLTFIIFCQFTNIVAFATPLKIQKNTLSLKKYVASTSPEISSAERSKQAKETLDQNTVFPHAVRELNHTLISIQQLLEKIDKNYEKGIPIAIEIKYLQTQLESLKDLDQKVTNNLNLELEKLGEKNKTDARIKQNAQLISHYRKNIDPILQGLESTISNNISKLNNRPLREIKTTNNFGKHIKNLKSLIDKKIPNNSIKNEQFPQKPTFRPSGFKPTKPNISGKVKPAYILQQKNAQPASILLNSSNTALDASISLSETQVNNQASAFSVLPSAAEDLAETAEIIVTQEMSDLVASLGNSPSRIFEWVKNNIESEFYYGSMKGSRGTFIEKSGNDVDTASLLMALFRSAGIPCRYVTGTIQLPIETAKNLTGVNDPQSVGDLAASAGIPGVLITSGSKIAALRLEHTWVEALVDYDPYAGATSGEGDLWVPLSPWYKTYEYQDQNDFITLSGFDADNYLEDYISDIKTESPVDTFKVFLKDFLKENHPGMSWQEGLRTRQIAQQKFRTLPNTLNFEVVSINGEYAELPDSMRHKVTISVPDVSLSHTFNLSDIVGKKVTFSYPPSDEVSKNLIDTNGGIENVNPRYVNLLPSLKVEGESVATGSVVNAGYYHTLQTTFSVPNIGTDSVSYSVISGAYYAVGLDPQMVSNQYLSNRISTYISSLEDTEETADNMDQITGEALYLAVMKYFNDVNTGDRIFAQSLKNVFLKQTSGAITGKSLVVYTLFGTPSELADGGYFVDAKRNIYTPISVTGDESRELDFMLLGGYNSSYEEHNLFEEFFHIEAISTLRLLAIAGEQGMPIYDIDSSNIDSILPLLTIDTGAKSAIQSAVSAGHKVKVHQANLTVQNWSGCGYIDLEPDTNAAGYIISGGWAGGSTIDNIKNWLGDKWGKFKNWFFGGDPVNIANGNLFHTEQDVSLPAVGMSITIDRYYNSLSDYNGPFGYGWSYTYDEKITKNSDDGSLTYKAGDGGNFKYTKNTDGTFKRPLGMYSTLAENVSGYVLTEKNGTRHFFNSEGRLTSIEDRNNNALSFVYNGDNLSTITGPAGREIIFTYNGNNKIESVTAPGNNIWSYSYDGDNLISITNNADQTISYTYYTDHKMASRTNAENGTVTYDYYSDGKAHSNLLPNGGVFLFSYNEPLGITTVTDPEGNSTIHYYNDQGAATGLLDPLGYEELYEYDENLNRIKIIDKNGAIVQNTYDSNGNLLSTTNQLNYTTTFTYEPNFNQIETTTDPMGNTTINTFDVTNGNLLSTTDPEGVVVEYQYFSNGLIQYIKKSGIIKTEFSYFPDGTVKILKDPYGNMTKFSYDELGRMKSKTDANDHLTQYDLDKAGNVLKTIDAEENEIKFAYNKFNMRTSLTDGKDHTTQYEYNNWGKLTKVTDPKGYEKFYTYNLNYNIESEKDKNGNTITYEYDALNRISKKIYSDGSELSYLYDANSNIIQTTDKNGVIKKQYDSLNRLIKVTDVYGQKIQYTYRPNGNQNTMTDPQGNVTSYEYYKNAKLKTITDPDNNITSYTYQNDLVESVVYPNETETRYAYDLNDRVIQIINKKSDGNIISSFEYVYDPVGNKLQMTDNEGVHTYSYDKINQVTTVNYPDGTYRGYSYDEAYNRSQLITPSATIDYTYDENNRMLTAGAKNYTYDNNGNQLTETVHGLTTTFLYNAQDQLYQITYPDNSSNEFSYNASGQRISKKDSSGILKFIYDGPSILMETDVEGVLKSRYVNSRLTMGAIYKKNIMDQHTYFLKDSLGSITQLTDTTGDVVGSYSYDIFGGVRLQSTIDDRGNKHTFTGKELDDDSSLIYFGARYYNAEIGRFINADSYTYGPDDERGENKRFLFVGALSYIGALNPLKLNLHIYGANNPIKNIDINGHDFGITFFILMVAALVALGLTAIADWRGDIESPWDGLKTFSWYLFTGLLTAIAILFTIAGAPIWVGIVLTLTGVFLPEIVKPDDEFFEKV
nr:DUF6531 domain-containing protein [uncultured Desulfobacter sp.]